MNNFLREKIPHNFTLLRFLKINSLMAETIKKEKFQNEIFINKLLNSIIIYSVSKIGNG